MLKRRTILAGLTVLGFTLAVSTKVYGQSTSEIDAAWLAGYQEAAAEVTTVKSIPLLGSLLSTLSSLLQVFYDLAGYWAG